MKALGRRQVIYSIVGVLALGLLVFGGGKFVQNARNPYKGLVTTMEVQMEESTRILFEQRLATMRAAIAAKEEVGEPADFYDWYDVAVDAYALGDLVTAREALEETLNLNANYAVAWNSYGNVLLRMGDLELAGNAYLQAYELLHTTEYAMDYANLLIQYMPDRKQEAREFLENAVRLSGQDVQFMTALAKLHLEEGNCEQALAHYEVAVKLAPQNTNLQDDYRDVQEQCSAR